MGVTLVARFDRGRLSRWDRHGSALKAAANAVRPAVVVVSVVYSDALQLSLSRAAQKSHSRDEPLVPQLQRLRWLSLEDSPKRPE